MDEACNRMVWNPIQVIVRVCVCVCVWVCGCVGGWVGVWVGGWVCVGVGVEGCGRVWKGVGVCVYFFSP